jgi:hypothetical protein
MSNWIRRCKVYCGNLDCDWSLIWSPDRFALLFHSLASHPAYFSISFHSSSWLVSKKTKTLVRDSEHAFTSARCDFSSLHEIAYCVLGWFSQFPTEVVWCISKKILSLYESVEARTSKVLSPLWFRTCTLRFGVTLDVSFDCIISLNGWFPRVSGLCVWVNQASMLSFSEKFHLRLSPAWRCEVVWNWSHVDSTPQSLRI